MDENASPSQLLTAAYALDDRSTVDKERPKTDQVRCILETREKVQNEGRGQSLQNLSKTLSEAEQSKNLPAPGFPIMSLWKAIETPGVMSDID